ncbi:TPA: Pvc16 family protein [Serratia marcescens]
MSENTIAKVNVALKTVLEKYFNNAIDIRFDLPEMNSVQPAPTVSVFLYDVHEDLELRQSRHPYLRIATDASHASWVNLNCNYLITYWETQSPGKDSKGPDSAPNNQAIQTITKTLQALLNHRALEGIEGAYARVIPPQENLSSLGTFWQALGHRPRLSLLYSITVPFLLDDGEKPVLIETFDARVIDIKTALSSIALDRASYVAGDEIVVTVTVKNAQGNAETGLASVLKVVVPHAMSQDVSWTDNNNGTYVARYVAGLAGVGLTATLMIGETSVQSKEYAVTAKIVSGKVT